MADAEGATAEAGELRDPRSRKPVFSGKYNDSGRLDTIAPSNLLRIEQDQADMSEALKSSVADQTVDSCLSSLDDRSKDGQENIASERAVGPFTVFDCRQDPGSHTTDSSEPLFDLDCSMPIPEEVNFSVNTEPFGFLNGSDNLLGWPDLFELDFPLHLDHSWVPSASLNQDSSPIHLASLTQHTSSLHLLDLGPVGEVERYDNPSSTLPGSSNAEKGPLYGPLYNTQFGKSVKAAKLDHEEAQTLLKHFHHHTLAHIWSMPVGKKTPFDTHIASAVETLARTTFMDQPVSHAALANLLALLAVSARHMAATTEQPGDTTLEYWDTYSKKMIKQAKWNWQQSLRHEIKPKLAKYKEHLMAAGALLCFAIVFDRQQDARALSIDAERLLRTIGLAKRRISRKVKLLHHTYSWNRIVGESSFVLRQYEKSEIDLAIRHLKASYANADRPEGPGSHTAQNPRLDDFLRFEPCSPSTLSEVTDPPETGEGLHDIHLEEAHCKSNPTYMLLYGISETWLSLLSQTTRLANVIEGIHSTKGRPDFEVTEAIEQRKGILESMICSYAVTSRPPRVSQEDRVRNMSRSNLVRAFNSALIIFFYRRIKKVHPLILQEHVNSVIQSLKVFDSFCKTETVDSSWSPWPAFISGCEAMFPDQREYISTWFDLALSKTGFTRYKTIKSFIMDLWRRQDEARKIRPASENQHLTWVQLSRELNVYMLLS
ncbi:unnamed protein product [Clonostachys rosea]|uniref:Arginine metabolism regulation protein II n=1 Tax=Bionectria ochroleuca TaxID=29856 RepID=A0ABY6TWE6_BIOOC|nr:unnamed protein product [Clonostachys rosea]